MCGENTRRSRLEDLIIPHRPQQILRGKALRSYLNNLERRPFSQIQKDALVGTLLGDGCLQYSGGIKAFYKFDQKASRLEYVNLLYSIFADCVGTPPKLRNQSGVPHSYRFKTLRMNRLDFYDDQFYPRNALSGKRKKVVPANIHRWLNPQSLAFWFMDDGSKNHSGGYYFHTEGFNHSEVVCLQQAMGRVFNLQCNVHKNNRGAEAESAQSSNLTKSPLYTLYIPLSNAPQFRSIVEDYMLDSMKYKLHFIE